MDKHIPATKSRLMIYGLIDPRDGEIFYIGQSSRGLETAKRHSRTSCLKGNTHKENLIKKLKSMGLAYSIVVLDTPSVKTDLSRLEIDWIRFGREMGWPLTNATDGGQGHMGFKHRPESRAKMSQARAGKKQSADHVKNNAAARTGRKLSDEHLKKMIASHTTPQYRDLISRTRTPAMRQFQRERMIALNRSRAGQKLSPERAEQARRASLGRKLTEHQKQKLSMANKGKPKSEEHKRKLRESLKAFNEKKRMSNPRLIETDPTITL